ncbi:MAG: TolC family protein [Candidatus Sericytochromatia bacterium]|nr:TolC family protein [Candidatus Sericytochromatia bacterium]
MRPWQSLLIFGLCLGTLAPTRLALAAPADLSLPAALERAVQHNPGVVQAQARLEQARLDQESQGWWWARAIRASLNLTNNMAGSAAVTPEGTLLPNAALGVNLNVGDLLTAPQSNQRSAAAVRIAEADYRRTVLDVVNQVSAAHQELLMARRQVLLAQAAVETAELEARLAARELSRGQGAVQQLANARLNARRLRHEVASAQQQVAMRWSQLVTLVGDPSLVELPRSLDAFPSARGTR